MHYNIESFHILECVDSTNNYAMQQVKNDNAKDADAWFAIEQTNGKGRRGKHWQANKGENIILSIVINTLFLKIYEQFRLTVAASLACYDLLKKYANGNTKIKWPNDLFYSDSKAGGILIENVIQGNVWQWAVIGIGININQIDFNLDGALPVSLKIITGKTYDPVELGKELYTLIIKRISALKANKYVSMLEEYNYVLYKRNEKVKLRMQNITFEITVGGVSSAGQLQTLDSLSRNFNFDEIEWIL